MTASTFPILMGRAIRTHRNKDALVSTETGERMTFEEIERRARRLAASLERLGLSPGDRVALLERNQPGFVVHYYAVTLFGGVVVPLNFRLTPRELASILQDARPRAVIYEGEYTATVREVRRLLDGPQYWLADEPSGEGLDLVALMEESREDGHPSAVVPEDAPCAILFTAGTTGRSKGAVRSHRAVSSVCGAYALGMRVDAHTVYLGVPPFFHIAGSECSLFPVLMQGGTAVTMRHFDPLRFLEVMAEERITHAFVVPSMAVQLLQLDWRDYDLSSLQVWFSASAPLPSAIRDEVRRRLPGVTMINGLGTTEAGPVANLSTPELDAKPGNCVGKPWMGIAVTVLTDGGEPTPPGHVGNLAVQSAGVMDGYLDNPEATAEVFQHGWYLTGDLARLDDEGYLYLVDRKRDMIISGGENIYAAEVEDVLYSMESVAEAAVVAQPHPVWGEVPIAFIVPKVGMTVTQDDVRQYCGRRLAGYKIPKATYIVDSLPRNTFGKVLKTVLREQLAAKLGDR